MSRALLLLLVAACAPGPEAGKDSGPAGSDTGPDPDPACTATITGLSPADGAVGVELDAPVVATFSGAVTAAEIDVAGLSGTVTLAEDGASATFVPDGGFASGTDYAVTARVCDSTETAAFTTVGGPLDVDLTDRTYDVGLDGSDVTWVAPNVGSVLAGEIQTDRILFMVQYADTARIDLVGAAGYEFHGTPAQYRCTYAFDFAETSYTGHPAFAAGPLDAEMEANDIPFDIFDLAVSGTFAADGSEATDVTITGLLDTRPLAEGLGLDICALATSFDDTCIACPDGEPFCLYLEVNDTSAPWREGLVVDADHDPSTDRYCD